MNIWAVLTLLVTLIYIPAVLKYKKNTSLLALFSAMWAAMLALTMLYGYGLHKVSDHFFLLIFLGVTSFTVGYWCARLIREENPVRQKRDFGELLGEKKPEYRFNELFIWLAYAAIFAYTALTLLRTMQLLGQGYSMERVHDFYLGRGDVRFFTRSFIDTFGSKIVVPCMYAIIPVSVLMLLEKKNRALCITGLCLTVLYGIATGGRFIFMYLCVDLLIGAFFFRKSISKKTFILIGSVAAAMVLVVLGITIFRRRLYVKGNYSDLFETYYLYYTLCMPLGDYWVAHVDAEGLMTHGLAFFRGILANIDYPVSKLGIHALTDLLAPVAEYVNLPEGEYINIAGAHHANAYVTWVYLLYLDLREAGVVLGSAAFGALAGLCDRIAASKKSDIAMAYTLLVAQAIVKTFVRFEFFIAAYILAFIALRVMFTKREKKVEKADGQD